MNKLRKDYIYLIEEVHLKEKNAVTLSLSGVNKALVELLRKNKHNFKKLEKILSEEKSIEIERVALPIDREIHSKIWEGRILSTFHPDSFKKGEAQLISEETNIFLLNCSRNENRIFLDVFDVTQWLDERELTFVPDVDTDDLINNGSPIILHNYNVNKGNCSLVHQIDSDTYYFIDFGGGANSYRDIIQDFVYLSQNFNVKIHVTHWDRDHYNYLRHINNQHMAGLEIIGPHQLSTSFEFIQTMGRCHRLGANIQLVENTPPNGIAIEPFMNFDRLNYHPNRVRGQQYNKNNSGLIFDISGIHDRALLPGDSRYNYINRLNIYNVILATHHGSRLFGNRSPLPIPGANAAVISGSNNGVWPHQDTINRLTRDGWDIYQFLPITLLLQ